MLKKLQRKCKGKTCYCIRTDINGNNAIKKSSMFVHTEIFIAKVFNVQFSFFSSPKSVTLIKAGSLPNIFFLSYNNNNKKM